MSFRQGVPREQGPRGWARALLTRSGLEALVWGLGHEGVGQYQARAGGRAGPQECPVSCSWGPESGGIEGLLWDRVLAPVRGHGARAHWEGTEEVTGQG